ncbi:MAG TPA: ABC transporter permease [Fimbriimonadaceae bacterium]|nr:ABC transporter permease [Fimbriimonadaceae bacterium]
MDSLFLVLKSTVTLSAPLLLAAMAGYTSERTGVINIALEGKMLAGCLAAGLVGILSGSAVLGVLAGVTAAVLMSLLHWLLTQSYSIDHIVSGMAVNAVSFGATSFLYKNYTDPSKVTETPTLPLPAYYAIAFVVPVALAWVSSRTRFGLRLRAVGGDPEKSRSMGLNPGAVRFKSLLLTGLFCGLSGTLIVSNTGYFTDGMTAGRGFIALAALIIGSWRPIPTMIACIAFGFLEALQLQLQGTRLAGAEIPRELWNVLPYLATVIALAGFVGKSRAPAGLGKP